MVRFLASVKDIDEATIASKVDIDILDLKNINDGALGFVGIELISKVKILLPNKNSFTNCLFFPWRCNSKIWIAFDLHAIVKFESRTVPNFPFSLAIFAFKTLILSFLYINQAPGFGLNP